jgi:thiol-disulfide isomerase/thioredoxin
MRDTILSLLLMLSVTFALGSQDRPNSTVEFKSTELKEEAEVETVITEEPQAPIKFELETEEVVKSTPIRAEKPVYTYLQTLAQINDHISSGGSRALTDPPNFLFKHVQWHDNEDGFRNYSDGVLRALTYQQLEWLHGLMHVEEVSEIEPQEIVFEKKGLAKEKKKVEEDDGIVLELNRVIYAGASWCGPCVTVKATKFDQHYKDLDWIVGSDAFSHLQIIDIDDHKKEYQEVVRRGGNQGYIPRFLIMKDGKVVAHKPAIEFVSNGEFNYGQFKKWIIEKGDVFGWEN